MDEVEVRIQAEINPTEDEAKVKQAVENMFGGARFFVERHLRGAMMIGEAEGTDGLTKFYNLLRRERIRDAARAVLYKGINESTIVFYLNKQVAYAGHVSFSQPVGESPLGPIKVEISCESPREVIDWLAPRTSTQRE